MKAPWLGRWSRAGVLSQLSLVARYQPPLRCHLRRWGGGRHAAAGPVADLPRMPMLSADRRHRVRAWRFLETLVEAGSGRCRLSWVVRVEDAGTRIGCEDPCLARCLGRGGTAAARCSVHQTGKATTAGRLAREGSARKELDAAWRTCEVLCAGASCCRFQEKVVELPFAFLLSETPQCSSLGRLKECTLGLITVDADDDRWTRRLPRQIIACSFPVFQLHYPWENSGKDRSNWSRVVRGFSKEPRELNSDFITIANFSGSTRQATFLCASSWN